MVLSDLHIGLIAIACDAVATGILALIMRPFVDANHDGKITPDEVKRTTEAPHDVVPVGKSLFDFGVIPLGIIALDAWTFAFAYGLMSVLTCNLLFPSTTTTSSTSWIAALWITFTSLVFMCAFCMNGVHVATSHPVHGIYYLCGLIPMALFKNLPTPSWILVVVIAFRLLFFVAMKFYVWPQYPVFYRLDPLFFRNKVDGSLELFTDPRTVEEDLVVLERLRDVVKLRGNAVRDYGLIHIPFPVYEILNGHVASYFTRGAVLAWILYSILVKCVGGVPGVGLLVGVVVGVSAVLLGVFVWWIPLEAERSKWLTLSHYYPRVSATIAFFIGAGLVSFSMRRGETDNGADLGIMLAFHIISLGLYFFGYVAVVRYFGFGKSFKRLFSLIPGHGGVVIEKTAGRPLLA